LKGVKRYFRYGTLLVVAILWFWRSQRYRMSWKGPTKTNSAYRVVRIKLFTPPVSSVCRVSYRVFDWCRKLLLAIGWSKRNENLLSSVQICSLLQRLEMRESK